MEITKVKRIKREFNKRHSHSNGQLIILESGLINVRADHGSWLVPEKRLAWIPKDMFHSSQALTEINGWTILTNEDFEKKLPNDICIIQASDLLFSLLKRIITTQNDSNTIFLNKAAIMKTLKKIKENSNVVLDFTQTKFLAYDVKEVINDFKENAVSKNIKLELKNYK